MVHKLLLSVAAGFMASFALIVCWPTGAQRDVQSEFVPAGPPFVAEPPPVVEPPPIDEPPPIVEPPPDTQAPAYTWSSHSNGKIINGGGRAGYLKACGAVQFGAPCNSRNKKHMLTKDFANYLMTKMPQCVSEGLRAQGHSGKFKKLIIVGDTYYNREISGGGPMSMHSTGRSIDLWDLNMVLDTGRKFDVDMTLQGARAKGTRKFYAAVVACWQNANRKRCRGLGGLTPRSGALDCTFDKDHENHVHMSMPFCPHKRGIAHN